MLPDRLLPSPRHWNASIIDFDGERWLAYRFHRTDLPDSRCAIGMVRLGDDLQPAGKSHLLELTGPTRTEHFEDPRLFVFLGRLHISYTEMRGYRPGVDYNCVVKYARLRWGRGRWMVEQMFQPRYGRNNGYSKEKNWVFFEADRTLYCFYQGTPRHVVLEIDEGKVVKEYVSAAPHWAWGTLRGGAAPVRDGDHFLHVFHSSLPSETPPHFVRYYAGAYTFEARPPFLPLQISSRPIAAGSEEDGHQVDPRYVEGWKPFVVFPCGLVPQSGGWLASFGVNDWQIVLSPLSQSQLRLVPADGSAIDTRYFRTLNGSRPEPILVMEDFGYRTDYLVWDVPQPVAGRAGVGYMKVIDPRVAEDLASRPHVEEIAEKDYAAKFAAVLR